MTGKVEVSIREMTISDYDAVISLWRASDSMTLRDADSKQSIGNYLERNAGLSFVALVDALVVGAVLVGTDGRRGYLQHLAVTADFQGQKIGRQLVVKATDALAGIGILKTHLFVRSDSQSVREFYAHLGWQLRDDVSMYSYNGSGIDNI